MISVFVMVYVATVDLDRRLEMETIIGVFGSRDVCEIALGMNRAQVSRGGRLECREEPVIR